MDCSQDLFCDSQLIDSSERSNDSQELLVSDGESSPKTATNGLQLLNTRITDMKKRQINDRFVQTLNNVKELEKSDDIVVGVEVLTKELTNQDKYFKEGGVNENMPIDAKCMLTNTITTKHFVQKLETDSKRYDPMEFAHKLLGLLNTSAIDESSDNEDNITRDDWIEFGKKYCRFHKFVPTFHFIHGTFDTSVDEELKQTKQRVIRPKPVISEVTHATQIDPKTKQNDDSASTEVELIIDTIKKLETKNNCDSLPYFNVVVNPNSMSQTVENIFHSSFLLKDGRTKMTTEDDIPYIGSNEVQQSDEEIKEIEDNGLQSVLSFTMSDWQKWVKHYQIRKPAIKHPKK